MRHRKTEKIEFNEHNLWLYIHGDPTEEMILSGVEYNFIKGEPSARRWQDQQDQFLIFIPNSWYDSFIDEMVPDSTFEDGAYEAHLNGSDVVIDIIDLCRWNDIDYRKLLTAEDRETYGIKLEDES